MIIENDKNYRTKDLTKTRDLHKLPAVKPTVKNNLSAQNLPDEAGELRSGNARTASVGPHNSLALSGFSFQVKK